jgi:hypothetical protein
MIKKVQISDELFWGFNRIINIDDFKSFEELVIYIKKELNLFLKENNLLCLVDMAAKLNLHNHMYNTYEDLYKISDNTIYLCGHCSNNDNNSNN